ncbi:TipAS antibiotic-recognition domain-containing protein [Bifidobacterium sp. ESL0763]|uniref:MerR family transcriptional regulator n=1 Tax=Bifidobacterium sp. ESL0763 TaxID=2983227 RepID=UPI0023F99966|nr:TipAS antibiotic-recognition domain-containing protein [Bifidobacterium sp. ESL0763]MDF7663940.1 TipAS antibiotic-recognition domain-containing protein [Bifidobacterium sp. ESL0763]
MMEESEEPCRHDRRNRRDDTEPQGHARTDGSGTSNAGDDDRPLAEQEALSVGEVSRMFHVSVRMLRHWDGLGLLTPRRGPNGYREYRVRDLNRLRRLLTYKELGIPGADIGPLLEAAAPEVIETLAKQRDAIDARIRDLRGDLGRLDRLIDIARKGSTMADTTDKTMHELQAEAQRRWGESTQWMEYAERKASTTDGQRREAGERMRNVERQLGEAKRRGVRPGSIEANALVEEHRRSIPQFEVSPSMHVLLGRMYAADERFARHYDDIEPGLAAWLHEAIDAAARAQGLNPARARWE